MRQRSFDSPIVWACLVTLMITAAGARGAAPGRTLPLSFEENRGQAPAKFAYVAHGAQYQMWIGPVSNVVTGNGLPASGLASVRTRFIGADRNARVRGLDLQTSQTNYFLGNSNSHWRTGIRNYATVRVNGIYAGIDLLYHANQGDLEYDFLVSPGADPSNIRLEVTGADQLRIDNEGDLVAGWGVSQIRLRKPVLYQDTANGRKAVEGAFELKGRRVRFKVGNYDREQRLVIDPILKYASYFGAAGPPSVGSVGARTVATDSAGNVYIAGIVNTNQLPVTSGAVQTNYAGGSGSTFLYGDAFVAKFSPTGAILFVTYLGGSGDDGAASIAVDAAGNVYVAGFTTSSDFPVTPGVLQHTYGGAGGNGCKPFGDAFVAKINSTGTQLLYSTYLGGTMDDAAGAIVVDAAGNAYVTGATLSTNFPLHAPLQSSMHGAGGEPGNPDCNGGPVGDSGDAFVAKLNPTATALVFSTYLGGSQDDAGIAIALDPSLNIYVAGATLSPDFPTSQGAFQTVNHGTDPQNVFQNSGDAFVAKLNSSGSALVYSTYLGGRGDDAVAAMFVDKAGTAYLTGSTSSPDFPVTTNALQLRYKGYYSVPFAIANNYGDAFVTRLNQTGTALLYSTFLGGSANDEGTGIAVDPSGLVYVSGATDSTDFPVTSNAAQPNFAGDENTTYNGDDARPYGDGFLAVLDLNSASLLYGTFYGGILDDGFLSLAMDPNGNVWLAGATASNNLKVTANAQQSAYSALLGSSDDALLVEFSAGGSNPPTVSAVENAASNALNVVSPGMIFVLYGQNVGPSALVGSAVDPVTGLQAGTLSQVSVLFNNIPSPLVYVVNKQVAGTVPYEVAGLTSTQVVVEVAGVRSAPFTVQVAPSAPGLFSVDFSGTGQAVIYNSDNSVNSAANAARRGSIIQIFGTGEGQTIPPGQDGLFSAGLPPKPSQNVSVTIGGVPQTQFAYVGGIPGEPPGVLQVNVTVDPGTPVGNQPIVVKVGQASSQPNLTVAIQ
jgi:uncharacterized protein (TIGR03437 family)